VTKAEVKNVVLAGPKVMALMLDAKGTQDGTPAPGMMRSRRRSLSTKKLIPMMPEGLGLGEQLSPSKVKSGASSRSRPAALSRQGRSAKLL